MSSLLNHNVPTPSLRHNRSLKAIVLSLATAMTMVGCDSKNSSNTEALVQVFEDKVVVDHSLVQTSIPERYQPSYNLEGALIPVKNIDISSPYPVQSASVEVKEGDKVEQGQALATIETKVAKRKIPFINNKFLDVYVDGVQVNKTDNSSQPTQDPSKKPLPNSAIGLTESSGQLTPADKANPSNTNPNQQDDTLVPITLVLKSPISGTVTHIKNVAEDEPTPKDEPSTKNSDSSNGSDKKATKENQVFSPVIRVAKPQKLQLVGKLPLSTQSQLSVGKPVYFTVHELHKEFTGQISHILPDPKSDTLTVRAPLVAGENSKALLKPGMLASMSIEYGQIELGVRLPRTAIHEATLDELTKKRPRPTSPIKGYVWIIEQDQKLAYTPVEVVQYFADSEQYLVSGISNESVVCLADLPKNSVGKTLTVD